MSLLANMFYSRSIVQSVKDDPSHERDRELEASPLTS